MDDALQVLLGLTLIVFMVGSLLEVGLELHLPDAVAALRNRRFVGLSLLWGFVLCPLLALGLVTVIPLAPPYAIGMLLLAMAPCAPFVPLVARAAGGDLAYVAAFMLLAAVGTVAYMPLAAPIFLPGFAADAWTIARPLVLYIALPLALGILARRLSEPVAEAAHPIVKRLTGLDSLVMVGIIVWLYRHDFVSAVGSYAILTQVLFYGITASVAYATGWGLTPRQRSVLALGVCTRNIGAAFAPLMSLAGADHRAVAMVALAVPLSVICGFGAARVFARGAAGRRV